MRSQPRNFRGMVISPAVDTVFHAMGVNLRYLAYVHGRIPE